MHPGIDTNSIWKDLISSWAYGYKEICAAWGTGGRIAMGRKFFVTCQGHLGFGPPNLARGDILCNFKTSTVGHFVREIDGHYEYVGECYKGVRYDDLQQYLKDGTAEIFQQTIDRPEHLFEIW
jgi:hypothetical protein